MIAWLMSVLAALAALLAAPFMVHAYQLESYQAPQYLRFVRENLGRCLKESALWAPIALLIGGVCALLAQIAPAWALWVMLGLAVTLPMGASLFIWRRKPANKAVGFTARVRRLMIFMGGLAAILATAALPFWLSDAALSWKFLVVGAGQAALLLLLPWWVLLGGTVALPVENAVKRHYYNEAKALLRKNPHLIKVGITGSYGKTSCKVILGTLLQEKYKTLITPESYNTPMGVTRCVREQWTDDIEVFVAEMGARHVGDIAEMCDLVGPTTGILTSVGPQHLETFHTLERVAATKYELIQALPPEGWAFFPADNDLCLELYQKTGREHKALFGFDGHGHALYMQASGVQLTPEGCAFTLTNGAGQAVACKTQLLGKHNIQNIAGCAAVAHSLGLTMEEIARGIGKLQAVPHRLQMLPTGNGVTVIDDAFNSNPAGARAALEVIGTFPGRKIIVTPGLVELGEREAAENRAFGGEMAKVVDIAILVARNGEAMREGMVAAGFEADNIILTRTLAQASAALGHLTQLGDVVLFENDLPDHYEL